VNTDQIFGIHSVSALLEKNASHILRVCVLKGRQDKKIEQILNACRASGITIDVMTRAQLDSLAGGNHQGVVAECRTAPEYDESHLEALLQNLKEPPFLLILDGITDPHNLGACLRSADAAGIHAVIVPKDKSAHLTPTVRKVASGAAEMVPLIRVTNLARTLRWLQQYNIWIIGAAGEAEQDIYNTDCQGALALVMGEEGKGLRRLTREHCDMLTKIPMAGTVSSLNVSVATGICLFEALRQRLN